MLWVVVTTYKTSSSAIELVQSVSESRVTLILLPIIILVEEKMKKCILILLGVPR